MTLVAICTTARHCAELNPAKVRHGSEKEFTAFHSHLDHFQTPPIQKLLIRHPHQIITLTYIRHCRIYTQSVHHY